MIGVIGGCGFVGTQLCKLLQAHQQDHINFDVVPRGDARLLDVENIDITEMRGVDTIINLAAVHRDDVKPRSRYDDVNVQGARNVCEAAREVGVRTIIFTSSVAVYGFCAPMTDETGDINFFNDYGRTKFEAEKIYTEWQEEDPDTRSLVIIRPTVVFGPGNRGNVFNLLNQINRRLFVMIGDGENIKSMAYVENVAAFIRHTLGFGRGVHIFNYVDEPELTMNELVTQVRWQLFRKRNIGLRLPAAFGVALGWTADFMATCLGKSLPVSSIRVAKFMATTQFKSAAKNTGFEPQFSLLQGLDKTLKYEFLENNDGQRVFYSE